MSELFPHVTENNIIVAVTLSPERRALCACDRCVSSALCPLMMKKYFDLTI